VNNHNFWKNQQKRKQFNHVPCNSNFDEFNKPPKKIFHHDHQALIVIVRKQDGTLLDCNVSGSVSGNLRDKLNFYSISSAEDLSSIQQYFYCFGEEDYDALCKEYHNGLLLHEGEDSAEQIDKVMN